MQIGIVEKRYHDNIRVLCSPVFLCPQVDRIDNKDRLLNITAELTCGVVNGQRMRTRPVIKPPWAEKREEAASESPPEGDVAESSSSSCESSSALSREQLKALRSQRGWPHFKDVFMLSSVDKEDVDTLKVGHTLVFYTLWLNLSL